jgi:transcriptional regulator with XRE-family HTH domain
MSSSAHSTESERLRALLREVRIERGITQEELAKKLKVPQSFVSKYESGERRVDLVELRRVCVALGVPLQTVIKRWEASLK